MRRVLLFQVHLWVGVAAALYVLVVSVTGAALVFRIHLQRAVHPELLTARTDGPQADIVTVLERVRDAYPRGRLSGVDAPTTVRPTHLAYVTEDDRFRTVLSDPVTAEVLGELPEHSVVRTLQDLHFDLLAGPTGRVINGIGALCLLLLCATGPFIWWPGRAGWRRAGFTVDWGRPWKRVTWELHGAVGIWTLVLTAGWAVTGAYFVFPGEFRAAVNRISPLTTVRPPQSNPDHRAYARARPGARWSTSPGGRNRTPSSPGSSCPQPTRRPSVCSSPIGGRRLSARAICGRSTSTSTPASGSPLRSRRPPRSAIPSWPGSDRCTSGTSAAPGSARYGS